MGVKYLNTFINNCKGGKEEINIKREIEYHKRTFKVEKPVIIIDILSIHQYVYTSEKEKLFGGRYDLYNVRIEEIFKQIIDWGAEIICIKDGPLFEDKTDTIIDRKNEKYIEEWELLQQIENNINVDNPRLRIQSLTPFFYNMNKIAKKFCTVITATREADQEIVYQANKKNALAIISNDTDFLIFDGKWQFWSGPEMNLEKGSINRFNKDFLRAHLSLSPLQMILFATMCGNDFLKYDMVEKFHRKLYTYKPHQNRFKKFYKIANIVRQNIYSLPPNLKKSDEDYLRNLIFRPQEKDIGMQHFKKSINFYCDVGEPVVYSSSLLEECSKSQFIFCILNDVPYTFTLNYFDLTKKDLKPYYQLIQPVVQRQIGTILKSVKKTSHNLKRTFIIKLTHEDNYKKIYDIPVFPDDELPPLEEFILTPLEKADNLYQLKLKLFCWHILPDCEYFIPETILNLPNEFVLTIATIAFLIENDQISLDEADCILFACACRFDLKQQIQLDQFKSITGRNCRIAFLFPRLYVHLQHSVKCLGLKNISSLITFDGLYYHYLITNIKAKSELISGLREEFKTLRIYSKKIL